jgi:hypothetical protein
VIGFDPYICNIVHSPVDNIPTGDGPRLEVCSCPDTCTAQCPSSCCGRFGSPVCLTGCPETLCGIGCGCP